MTAPKKLTPSEFAAALQMHRARLGLTQAEAAALLDVSPRTLWRWEHGALPAPRPTQMGALAIFRESPKTK